MRKILSFFATIILLATAGWGICESNNTLTCNGFEYVLLPDNTAKITKYCGKSKQLYVPNKLNDYDVKVIGESAFSQSSLQVVMIQNGIETIEAHAFEMNPDLSRVAIPESTKIIGDYAFSSCAVLTNDPVITDEAYGGLDESIEKQRDKVDSAQAQLKRWIDGGKKSEVDINKQREKVKKEEEKLQALVDELAEKGGKGTFVIPAGSSIFSNGLEHIGDFAFAGCKLGNITIPDSITSIGKNPFAYCHDISITVSPKHSALAVKDNVLYSKSDKRLVCFFSEDEEFEIPQGILLIDDFAFNSKKL